MFKWINFKSCIRFTELTAFTEKNIFKPDPGGQDQHVALGSIQNVRIWSDLGLPALRMIAQN